LYIPEPTEAALKNIQVIDGAVNCEYPIYAATLEEFDAIFPLPGQDLELVEDFISRVGEDKADAILGAIFDRALNKKLVSGVHGTLFYEREGDRSFFPLSRREADWQAHTVASLRNGS
jgi:hypothetical protein